MTVRGHGELLALNDTSQWFCKSGASGYVSMNASTAGVRFWTFESENAPLGPMKQFLPDC